MQSELLKGRWTCKYLESQKVYCWQERARVIISQSICEVLIRRDTFKILQHRKWSAVTRNMRPSLADVARRWLLVVWHPRKSDDLVYSAAAGRRYANGNICMDNAGYRVKCWQAQAVLRTSQVQSELQKSRRTLQPTERNSDGEKR